MRSRSALIAFVAAATTLALVGLKQPKTVALPSLGSSPESPVATLEEIAFRHVHGSSVCENVIEPVHCKGVAAELSSLP